MIAGSALGLTDAAHSSIIDGCLGAGLEEEVEFWSTNQKIVTLFHIYLNLILGVDLLL